MSERVYDYDGDMDPGYKKQKIEENNSVLFQEWLNKKPRPVQESLFSFITENIGEKIVIELPTGGGKSALAGFTGCYSMKNRNYKRIVYVTSSLTLQKQVAEDAETWCFPIFKKDIVEEVVCLFGRNNYFCPERVVSLLNSTKIESIVDSKSDQEYVFEYITSLRFYWKTKSINHEVYKTPFRQKFWEKLKLRNIKDEIIDTLWSEITSSGGNKKGCGCTTNFNDWVSAGKPFSEKYKKTMSCGYCRCRFSACQCNILIMNMDSLSSFSKHVGLRKFINPNDFVVIDEAHMLCKRAKELFVSSPFNLEKVFKTIDYWKNIGVKLCDYAIDKTSLNEFDSNRAQLTFEENAKNARHQFSKTIIFFNKIEIDEEFNKVLEQKETYYNSIYTYGIKEPILSNMAKILCSPDVFNLNESQTEDVLKECKFEQIDLHGRRVLQTDTKEKVLHKIQYKIIENLVKDSNMLKICDTIYKHIEKETTLDFVEELEDEDETKEDDDEENKEDAEKLKKNPIEKFIKVVRKCHNVLNGLIKAKKAFNKEEWLDEKELYEQWIPLANSRGIDYEATYMHKGNMLKSCIWDKLDNGVMIMSATISKPGGDEDTCFDDFKMEVGLPPETRFIRTKEVFNTSRVTICVPKMEKYRFNLSKQEWIRYNQQRIDSIQTYVKMNPKATLVFGNSVEDYQKNIIPFMKSKLASHIHIDYNSDISKYNNFEKGSYNNVIIYGSEKLWTGLNLPGRIGMVVILKPFNAFRKNTENYYRIINAKYNKNNEKTCLATFNSMYRYNTCRDTIQASGRLMRTPTDSGIILFLSNNFQDAEMLNEKYENASFETDVKIWPYNL
tara:strand:+ start:2228 stop:4741 length:2514 start_codon:yes stop_codon:yes gene_type:complete